jgi:hypothetical protein
MRAASERVELEKKLDAGGWGLFFVWVGIAMFANVGWGVGLVGVGVVTLGAQVARKVLGITLDFFALAVGTAFVVGGIWSILDVTIELVPILCIAAGLALLSSALGRSPRAPRSGRRIGPQAPAQPPA